MKLVLPSTEYESSYMDALREAENETQDTKLRKPAMGQSFADFVRIFFNEMNPETVPPGYVPTTMFWLIDNNTFIGRLQIRHSLTESLFNYGGHIGYYIRSSMRNKGYGSAMLKLGLSEAKKMGFTEVLVTCDEDNLGSQKIIEKNGGELENTIDNPGHPRKHRYWITV